MDNHAWTIETRDGGMHSGVDTFPSDMLLSTASSLVLELRGIPGGRFRVEVPRDCTAVFCRRKPPLLATDQRVRGQMAVCFIGWRTKGEPAVETLQMIQCSPKGELFTALVTEGCTS